MRINLKLPFCTFILIAFSFSVLATDKESIFTDQVNKEYKLTVYENNKRVSPTESSNYEEGTAENTLWLYLKANNKEELNKLYDNSSKMMVDTNHFKKMQVYKTEPAKNYYELEDKLEFSNEYGTFAIIKLISYNSAFPKPLFSAKTFQKINDTWYLSVLTNQGTLTFFVTQLKKESLSNLFYNQSTGNKKIDSFISKMQKNGSLDFPLVLKTYSAWFDEKEKYKEYIDYFVDKEHSPFMK
jgi:hypothetical protein